MTVVFGARLIVPSAAKFVATMFVDPLLKFTEPVPVTFSVVAKTGPWKFTVVPVLPPAMLSRNGPPGWVTPMAPNTVELLLNTMLPWLEAAVETAWKGEARVELLEKISIAGPPTTPTLNVPVVPDPDMSTPFSEPVGLSGITPGPTAVCRWARPAGEPAIVAAMKSRGKKTRFMEGATVLPYWSRDDMAGQ
jgi:hypothetical protein